MSKKFVPLSSIVIEKGLQTGPFGSQLKANEYTSEGIPIVMPKDIEAGRVSTKSIARTSVQKASQLKKHFIKPGDILFPRRGDLGRIAVASTDNEGWICGTGCLRARIKENISFSYIHQFLMLPQVLKWLETNALGQTMLNLNTEIIGELPIYLPSLAEQKQIAFTLEQWDTAIEKTEALIDAKERQFGWLVTRLINKSGHKKKQLSDFISEVSVRNRGNEIDRVLSVTNHSGFVLPEDQFERRVASANVSNYKIVQQGQYAYNPSRINVGSIARLDDWDNGILSPMYTVFKLDQKMANSDYFLHWLSSGEAKQRIKKSAQGSVRETVSFGDLGAIPICLPELSVQQNIANTLNTAQQEITLLKKLADQYRTQKRGLMQKLLSGEWHIKNKEAA